MVAIYGNAACHIYAWYAPPYPCQTASSPSGGYHAADQESVEKPKTFELRNIIFDLDEDELGKRDIKAWRVTVQ